MRIIIEEMYYGNIVPTDRDVVKGGEYAHLLHLLSRNSTALEDTLTEAQKDVFEKKTTAMQGSAMPTRSQRLRRALKSGFGCRWNP